MEKSTVLCRFSFHNCLSSAHNCRDISCINSSICNLHSHMIYFTFVTKLLLQLSVRAKLDQRVCFTMLSVLVIKVSKNKNISTVSPVGFEKGHVCWLPPLVCFFKDVSLAFLNTFLMDSNVKHCHYLES